MQLKHLGGGLLSLLVGLVLIGASPAEAGGKHKGHGYYKQQGHHYVDRRHHRYAQKRHYRHHDRRHHRDRHHGRRHHRGHDGAKALGAFTLGFLSGNLVQYHRPPPPRTVYYYAPRPRPNNVVVVPPQRTTNYVYTPAPSVNYAPQSQQHCREFQKQVVVGGRLQNAYGVACYRPDGSWEVVR